MAVEKAGEGGAFQIETDPVKARCNVGKNDAGPQGTLQRFLGDAADRAQLRFDLDGLKVPLIPSRASSPCPEYSV